MPQGRSDKSAQLPRRFWKRPALWKETLRWFPSGALGASLLNVALHTRTLSHPPTCTVFRQWFNQITLTRPFDEDRLKYRLHPAHRRGEAGVHCLSSKYAV